jgi:Fe-S cluster assembly protein SufD
MVPCRRDRMGEANGQNVMKLSQLPSRTWYWLGMNYVKMPENEMELSGEGPISLETPDEDIDYRTLSYEDDFAGKDAETGIGSDLTKMIEKAGVPVHALTAKAGMKHEDPVRVNVTFRDGALDADVISISAEKDSSVLVVTSIDTEESVSGHGAVQTRYHAEDGARITLVQVIKAGDDFRLMSDIGGDLGDGADFSLIQIVLSGRQVFLGNYTGLYGKGSSLETKLGYQCTGDDVLDVNYVADHTGKNTNSDIEVSGVLSGNAQKLFRGTIDFKKGCAGAKGYEKEDVLLLDETVRNKTIPVILCAEEDVEGDHGATIGKLDQDTMFYLESRGIPEDAIYEMMAKARIESVAACVPDELTRQTVHDFLNDREEETDEQ